MSRHYSSPRDLRAVLYVRGLAADNATPIADPITEAIIDALIEDDGAGRETITGSDDMVALDIFFRDAWENRILLCADDIAGIRLNGRGEALRGRYLVRVGPADALQKLAWLTLSFDPGTGRMLIGLSAKGFAALRDSDRDTLLQYLNVMVEDRATAQYCSYGVQFVATTLAECDAAVLDEEAAAIVPTWATAGEYHSGFGKPLEDPYNVVAFTQREGVEGIFDGGGVICACVSGQERFSCQRVRLPA